MNISVPRIDAAATVDQVVRDCPATIGVFNEFGIDSCCGGSVPISVAAERDGADAQLLLQRLNEVIARG